MSGIGLIYNPRAGKNNKKKISDKEFAQILGEAGEVIGTRSIPELEQAIQHFKNNRNDILAISGGDGTVHLVLTTLIITYGNTPLPRILILRSGTMNTVTNSLNIKGDASETLKKVVEYYRHAQPVKTVQQQLMKVNDQYGFMAGGGFITNFLDDYYSSKKPGPLQGAKMIGHLIFSTVFKTSYARTILSSTPLRVSIDGRQIPQSKFMYFMGSTIKDIGLSFSAMHHAYTKPGHFHFQLSSMSPATMIPRLPCFYAGKDFTHKDMFHHGPAKNVDLTPEGNIKWMMDGEIYEADGPLQLSAGPEISIISL